MWIRPLSLLVTVQPRQPAGLAAPATGTAAALQSARLSCQSHQILVRLKCKVEEIAYFLGRIAPVFMSVLCAPYHPPLFAPPPLGVVVGMVQGAPGDAGDEAQAVQGQRGSSSARCSSPLLPPNNGTRLTPLGSPCLAPAPAPAPAHPALSPVPGEQTLT